MSQQPPSSSAPFPLPPRARRQLQHLQESHTTPVLEREYTTDERSEMAKSGQAMPDGSFPIKTPADLPNAIHLWSHSENPQEAKAHIVSRAHALGLKDQLPLSWASVAESHQDNATEIRMRESGQADVRLLETSPGKHILEVTLIRSGTSKNGNTYPPHVLREAIPLFEGTRAFADHQSPHDLPERSVRDLVGYYKHVHLDEAGRLRGQLHLVPGNDWLFSLLSEAEGNPDLCGLSIDAWGTEDQAGKGSASTRLISRLNRVMSCDIVTRPSAGGSIDRLLQSDRSPNPTETTTMEPETAEQRARAGQPAGATPVANKETEGTPKPTSPAGYPDLAALIQQMTAERNSLKAELSRVAGVLNPSSSPKPEETAAAQILTLAEELKRDRDSARASSLLDAKLREADLPEPVAHKLKKRFTNSSFEPAHLDEAIADEKDSLAALTSLGAITGMNYEKSLTTGYSEIDKVQAAMDALFGIYESDAAKAVPPFAGIREAFRVCTGVDIGNAGGADRALAPQLANALSAKIRSGRLAESDVLLREADVTTSSFSYLLGTSMNKRLLADYQAWPSEWQKFSTIVPIKDFKQQDRVRLGAFGSLSTVAEDAAYITLTIADTRAIYTAAKRGNLVQITRETIINDDLYAIKQIPQKLAVAAAFTLAEFVYNLMAPSFGNIYDGHPLFDSINHLNTGILAANLATTNSGAALSSAALQTAVIAMRKQTNLAAKPIGLKPRFLLVPPDLEFTAMTILKSAGLPGGNNNDVNPMMGYAEPVVSPQLNSLAAGPASTHIWIAVADPRIIDTLEVGFVGGQANPVLLIQDMPLYGLNFSQDVISYKVRHEYGGCVVDYRGFYLGNN